MKVFFVRAFALSLIGLSAGSFLSMAFPGHIVFPILIFSFSIALALSRGFLESLPAVVLLGILADIATLGRIGLLSGFAVGLAYTASFFSRRFVVEHSALAGVFSGLLSGFAVIVFPVFSEAFLYGAGAVFSHAFDGFSLLHGFLSLILGMMFSTFAMAAIRKYDDVVVRLDPGLALRM